MGVHGLTSWMAHMGSLGTWHTFPPRDTQSVPFVVDGSAFLYQIGLSNVVGGDYAVFKEDVKRYIEYWRAVGLEPVVVWDGPFGSSKLDTVLARTGESIAKVVAFSNLSNPSPSDCKAATRLPPLAWIACVDAMRDVQVEMKYAEEEADWVTADLAGSMNGFCTSNDSDYFIFPIDSRGYVPLSSITYGSTSMSYLPRTPSSGKPTLTFRAYKPKELANYLQLPMAHLPVLAALIGNDLADHLKLLLPSTREMRYPTQVDKKSITLLAARLALVDRDLSTTDALAAVLARLAGPAIVAQVTHSLLHSIASYTLETTSSTYPFHPSPSDTPSQANSRALYAQACADCRIGMFLPCLLKHGIMVAGTSVEDQSVKSATVTVGRPLRMFMYEMLANELPLPSVSEWTRRGGEVFEHEVEVPSGWVGSGSTSVLAEAYDTRVGRLVEHLSPGRSPPIRHPLSPILLLLGYMATLSIPRWTRHEVTAALIMYCMVGKDGAAGKLETKARRQRSVELETGILWVRIACEILLLTTPRVGEDAEGLGDGLARFYGGFSAKTLCSLLGSNRVQLDKVVAGLSPSSQASIVSGLYWLGL